MLTALRAMFRRKSNPLPPPQSATLFSDWLKENPHPLEGKGWGYNGPSDETGTFALIGSPHEAELRAHADIIKQRSKESIAYYAVHIERSSVTSGPAVTYTHNHADEDDDAHLRGLAAQALRRLADMIDPNVREPRRRKTDKREPVSLEEAQDIVRRAREAAGWIDKPLDLSGSSHAIPLVMDPVQIAKLEGDPNWKKMDEDATRDFRWSNTLSEEDGSDIFSGRLPKDPPA